MAKELSEAAKAQRAAYLREYRRKHKEQQAEYTRRYWEKKAREAEESDSEEV